MGKKFSIGKVLTTNVLGWMDGGDSLRLRKTSRKLTHLLGSEVKPGLELGLPPTRDLLRRHLWSRVPQQLHLLTLEGLLRRPPLLQLRVVGTDQLLLMRPPRQPGQLLRRRRQAVHRHSVSLRRHRHRISHQRLMRRELRRLHWGRGRCIRRGRKPSSPQSATACAMRRWRRCGARWRSARSASASCSRK